MIVKVSKKEWMEKYEGRSKKELKKQFERGKVILLLISIYDNTIALVDDLKEALSLSAQGFKYKQIF